MMCDCPECGPEIIYWDVDEFNDAVVGKQAGEARLASRRFTVGLAPVASQPDVQFFLAVEYPPTQG